MVVLLVLASMLASAGSSGAAPTSRIEMSTLVKHPDGSLVSETVEVSPAQAAQLQASAVAGSVLAAANTPGIQASAGAKLIAAEPLVEFSAFADDPQRSNQWSLDHSTFETASGMVDASTVTIAVLDTGIRGTHEELSGVLVSGADFVLGSGDGLVADHFHGSHVAGIAGAVTGNGKGIEAAATGVRIMPVRVLDSSGSGSSTGVANGIIWAADHGADVINLSLGSTTNSTVVASAIDYAIAEGVVVVAASGNSGNAGNPTMYPAALDNVLSVGSVNSSLTRSGFSGYGSWLDVVAPGEGILSLHHGGDSSYAYANGTSMASPHASAAVALLLAADPTLSPAEVRSILKATAVDLGPVGDDVQYGAGFVDPAAAILSALGEGGGGTSPDSGSQGVGYAFVTSSGRVLPLGDATSFGSMEGQALAQPVIAATSTPSGNGYWMAGGDGGVFTFGDAAYHGSTGDIQLYRPIVGMAPTKTGNGYWLVASDGGVFAFGDAMFHGSTGGIALAQPIVGMAPTKTGNGYWLVASDGGIFAFGDAGFYGSTGGMALDQPIVGMAPTKTGNGYWLVASDGGIFAFGDAGFYGSTGGMALDQPIVGMAPTNAGNAYWMFARDGGVFSFGAPYAGSAAGLLNPGETAVALVDISS
ncbi:MAG: S8 family serine peptidase [Acidimicrobiales bacterium]